MIKSFKDIFKQNEPKLLKNWIAKVKSSGIKEIISFTNGVERDYDAIKNAVYLPYNNGLHPWITPQGSFQSTKANLNTLLGNITI